MRQNGPLGAAALQLPVTQGDTTESDYYYRSPLPKFASTTGPGVRSPKVKLEASTRTLALQWHGHSLIRLPVPLPGLWHWQW
jgi:hypothetical protein